MALKFPPPPTLASKDAQTQQLNRWLIEIQSILNSDGTVNIGDSPVLTGTPTAPTAPGGTNTTQIATTAFVLENSGGVPSTTVPLVDATPGEVGTSTHFARADHVHPTDTSRAPLVSPAFTGTPTAPTAPPGTSSGQIATTDFVTVADALLAPLASPTFTGTPEAPTAAPGTDTTQIATTAFVGAADALLAPLASPALTGTPTAPTAPLATNTTQLATTAFVLANASGGGGGISVLRSYLAGLALSTAGGSAAFSVAAGTAADSTNAVMVTLIAAMSKTTAGWAVGAGNGALDTGAIAANTWYHVHLIDDPATNAVDVLISLSATAPTLPTGFTLFRRIGSMRTNGSSQWIAFTQFGDDFSWGTPVFETGALVSIGTAASDLTLTVPTGVQVNANMLIYGEFSATGAALFSPLDVSDTAPAVNGLGLSQLSISTAAMNMATKIRTSTSALIRARSTVAATNVGLTTLGWTDTRGRDF